MGGSGCRHFGQEARRTRGEPLCGEVKQAEDVPEFSPPEWKRLKYWSDLQFCGLAIVRLALNRRGRLAATCKLQHVTLHGAKHRRCARCRFEYASEDFLGTTSGPVAGASAPRRRGSRPGQVRGTGPRRDRWSWLRCTPSCRTTAEAHDSPDAQTDERTDKQGRVARSRASPDEPPGQQAEHDTTQQRQGPRARPLSDEPDRRAGHGVEKSRHEYPTRTTSQRERDDQCEHQPCDSAYGNPVHTASVEVGCVDDRIQPAQASLILCPRPTRRASQCAARSPRRQDGAWSLWSPTHGPVSDAPAEKGSSTAATPNSAAPTRLTASPSRTRPREADHTSAVARNAAPAPPAKRKRRSR